MSVNVEMLLPTLTSEMTRVGEWINFIGYVTAKKSSSAESQVKGKPLVLVQALLAWPARQLDIPAYESLFLQESQCGTVG